MRHDIREKAAFGQYENVRVYVKTVRRSMFEKYGAASAKCCICACRYVNVDPKFICNYDVDVCPRCLTYSIFPYKTGE